MNTKYCKKCKHRKTCKKLEKLNATRQEQQNQLEHYIKRGAIGRTIGKDIQETDKQIIQTWKTLRTPQ